MYRVRRQDDRTVVLEEFRGERWQVLPVDSKFVETLLTEPIGPEAKRYVRAALAEEALVERVDWLQHEQQALSDLRRRILEGWSRARRWRRRTA